ncbi:DUF3592 domain-containing protein [Spirillospora sp. NPDC048832]
MLRKGPRLRRGVHVGFAFGAVVLGLIAVTWGGGSVAAALDQWGKHRTTARVVSVHAHEYPKSLGIRYTTREGRDVLTVMDERHAEDVAKGERIEILYDPGDPERAQRYQRLGSAPVVVLSFAAAAAVLGAAAYRTRGRPAG